MKGILPFNRIMKGQGAIRLVNSESVVGMAEVQLCAGQFNSSSKYRECHVNRAAEEFANDKNP